MLSFACRMRTVVVIAEDNKLVVVARKHSSVEVDNCIEADYCY